MNSIDEIGKTLTRLTNQDDLLKRRLISVYVFGSAARGKEKKKSDIDLAFVFDDTYYKSDPFAALQKAEMLSFALSKKMQKTTDVTILNGASLSFSYHAVRDGKCIFERNATDRILYEVTLDNKYQDFAPFIRELRKTKRRSLIGRD